MEPLIIFGIDGPAARAALEAERSGQFALAGFVTVDAAPGSTFLGHPVLDRKGVKSAFNPASVRAFAACDPRFLNQDRLALYLAAKQLGYRIASIVSRSAVVAEGVRLRENVFIDAGARVLDGANLGANAWVLGNAIIGSRAKLGSSCWIGEGASVGDDASLGKNCVLAGGASIAPGVALPAWTSINLAARIGVSPRSTIFLDPLFPSEVVLRGGDPRN